MAFNLFKPNPETNPETGTKAIGPAKCGTCATSCFGQEMPLGKGFGEFGPMVRQKFEELRTLLTQVDVAYRSGRMGEAGGKRTAAQDKIIEIIPLVADRDFERLAQTVERMVAMHSGNDEVRAFIDSE